MNTINGSRDESVLDMRFAEIDLPPSAAAVRGVYKELLAGAPQAPMRGLPELREQLSEHLKSRGVRARPEEIVPTTGASGAFSSLLLVCTRPGDGVLLPDPGFPGYRKVVRALGRSPIFYETSQKWDQSQLEAEIDRLAPQARALTWISPHNPTGYVYDQAVARSLANVTRDHELFLICDEVFSDLTWSSPHFSPLVWTDPDFSAGIWSGSKSMRLAGLRIGWLLAKEATAEMAAEASWALVMGASLSAQLACLESLKDYDAVLRDSRAHLQRNLEAMRTVIGGNRPLVLPEGGPCIWLDIRRTGLSSRDFSRQLSEVSGVQVLPGDRFGDRGEGFVRICGGAKEAVVAAAIPRIAEFIGNLMPCS